MQQLNRHDLTTQAGVPSEEPTFPVRTQPGRPARGRRIAAIVGLLTGSSRHVQRYDR